MAYAYSVPNEESRISDSQETEGSMEYMPEEYVEEYIDEPDNPFKSCRSGAESGLWLESAVKLLLTLVEEYRPLVGKTAKFKNKEKMWMAIKEKLSEKGYNYSQKQISNKYFSLKRSYKKTKDHNNKTGRERRTCPYEGQLDNILKKRPAINPEHVLDSSSIEEPEASTSQTLFDIDSNASLESCAGFPNQQTRRNPKPQKIQEAVLEELQKLREDRKEFYGQVTAILEKKMS